MGSPHSPGGHSILCAQYVMTSLCDTFQPNRISRQNLHPCSENQCMHGDYKEWRPHIVSPLPPDSSLNWQDFQQTLVFILLLPVYQIGLFEQSMKQIFYEFVEFRFWFVKGNVFLTMECMFSSSFGEAKDRNFLEAMWRSFTRNNNNHTLINTNT